MESNKIRESHSDVQNILSDWWGQQGCKINHICAVRMLQDTWKEIDLKPLASKLVISKQPTSRHSYKTRSRTRSRSRSGSRSRWKLNFHALKHTPTRVEVQTRKCVVWAKTHKLILLLLVLIISFLYLVCDLGHSIATSGNIFFLTYRIT